MQMFQSTSSETRGPWATLLTWETSKINQHIWAKLWLYSNVEYRRKKAILYLLFENWMVVICKTLNPLNSRMLWVKFGWNWPSGSGEDYLILSTYFCYFIIIPLENFKRNAVFLKMMKVFLLLRFRVTSGM